MKELLIGNAAAARGIYEAGVKVVSSYPGTPSTEITEFVSKYDEIKSEWAPNEKVALEVAFGASLAGARSACAMKHVGLNVAADPLYTLSYTGVNGGIVVCVADDPGMHSSQNEQDTRRHAIASKVPVVEPADSQECLDYMKAAFELSEKFDTPVIFRTCTRIAHSQSIVKTSERVERENIPYEKNIEKFVMLPANAKKKHPIVEERTKALIAYAENCPFNRVETTDSELGIITSGTCYQYTKEVFGDSVNILKLGMTNPLPEKLIRDFASKVKRLVVIEELDPVIEEHVNRLGIKCEGKSLFTLVGEYSQTLIAKAFGLEDKAFDTLETVVPPRPPVMCAGCPHRGLFFALAKNKLNVLGDIGCYTLGAQAPLRSIDSVLCMGASVSGIHGFNKVGEADLEKKTVAVIGDSTFIHSGITGLINIAYNATNSTVIILDNSITGMTGHQQNPTTGFNIKGDPAAKVDLEALCRAVGIERVRVVDPYNIAECEQAVKEELAIEAPSVIISRRPCALLKYVKHKAPLKVDPDKCRSCRMCMKIGCPAIRIRDGKANIDDTLCVGCEVCTQLCPFGAIEKQ